MADIFKKSSAASIEARNHGNRLYLHTSHDQEVHKSVLLQYSKSVAFAPKDSTDELAKAYGNRSALLMHLNLYEKCTVDIGRALKITESEELRRKLESRKAKCANAMRHSNAIADVKTKRSLGKTLKLPIMTPSVDIPSASEAVTAKYNKKFGRHLVSTRYIKPGEMIVAERGYVCFPIVKQRHVTCSHCLSFAWNGIPCDYCAFVIYCCETCKADAWNEYHDVECSLFPLAPPLLFQRDEEFLPYLMVALRLLIKAIKSEGMDAVVNEFDATNGGNSQTLDGLKVEGKLRSDKFRSCVNLISHEGDGKNKYSKNDPMMSHLIDSLFHHTSLFKSNENRIVDNRKTISQLKIILKRLANIVDYNNFEYQAFVCECNSLAECRSKCESSRGVVLAPFSCLINHSCFSNVSRVFLPNGKIVMFTTAPVKRGQQLFVNYGTIHTEKKQYRQQLLQKYFHFSCKCQACEEDWPSDPLQAELKQDEEALVMMKIVIDFKKYFPSSWRSSVMNPSEDDWQFDEETLKHAVKLSELTYKHLDNTMLASYYNLHYGNYLSSAFHVLYGEKFAIPDKCY